MSDQPQADLTSFRWTRIDNNGLTRISVPSPDQAADFVLGPFAPSKMATTGFLIQIQQPTVGGGIPPAGGYTITVWLKDSATKKWASFASLTIDFAQLFVTYDVDACELWFQFTGSVGTAGLVDFGIAEQ